MSYQTGSAANLNELLDAIRTFAIARGWTVDKWTSGSNLLFLSKGICFVQMQGSTASQAMYDTGTNVTVVETTLRMTLSTGVTTSLTTYNSHPGSLVTSATDGDRIEVNDLTGPFGSYHLFADSTIGDHIHVVVQSASDRWQHFSFGYIDKGNLTHSGVTYLTGTSRCYWRDGTGSTAYTPNDFSIRYNNIALAPVPFALSASQSMPINSSAVQLYAPDALPNNANWPTMVATFGGTTVMRLLGCRNQPSDFPNFTSTPYLLTSVIQSPASQWGGNVTMWALPAVRINSSISQACYVGDYPNVRFLNMEGMTPQQEISLGSETWMVFPVGRQTSWGTKSTVGLQFATGHYALAYKKVA